MTTSFDLLTEPWLPCAPLDGGPPVARSLPEALAEAHQYRELVADSPLVGVAIHRLLLAVLHRAYLGPRDAEQWRAMRAAERFDGDRIRGYLMDSRWRAHFDLFDGRRPFYQVAEMADARRNSVAKLAVERASGNNITLFDHTTAETGEFTPAQAARYLAAFQVYALGGGVSRPFPLSDGPLARDYTVLVRGQTLFETLMLNLQRYDDELPHLFGRAIAEDSAWWERDHDPEPDREGTTPRGYCDYLTWQSRRVRLNYDEADEVIRTCQVGQNLKVSQTAAGADPFKSYRQDDQRGVVARRLSEDKAVWRDSHALLEEARNGGSRPEALEWLAALYRARRLGSAPGFDFEVAGFLTDGPQATVLLWRRERLPLPLSYLAPEGKPLRDELNTGLELAEAVSRLFRVGSIQVKDAAGKTKAQPTPVWVLAKDLLTLSAERVPDRKDIAGLVEHFDAERTYWGALEPPFRGFLRALASEPADARTTEAHFDLVLAGWRETLRGIARRTFDELVAGIETDARSLRAAALAQRQFNWMLRQMLPAAAREPAAVGAGEVREARG